MTFFAGTTNIEITLDTGTDLTTVDEAQVRIVSPNRSVTDLTSEILTPASSGLIKSTFNPALVTGRYELRAILKYSTRYVTSGKATMIVE